MPSVTKVTRAEGGPRRPVRRILIYSHDTFGLGHLRRSRAIANALAGSGRDLQILVLSGSPVVDSFAAREGVSYVRLPGVSKRTDGGYASLDARIPLGRTIAGRMAVIARAAAEFRPDLAIVDKEPTGFHGEMLPTLEHLSAEGCRLVLGLRDILDDPELLAPEWERKDAAAAVRAFYDEIWVYGIARIHEPLAALGLGPAVAERLHYTGYLRRDAALPDPGRPAPALTRSPFILVTPGGGGDGAGLIDWVIAAYEADPGIALPALIAFGPFLDPQARQGFEARIARTGRLASITFDSEIEVLMRRAEGIVAMGGYNTFCEILSFDLRAVLVPRTEPRREQLIRARAAEALGLARVLLESEGRDPLRMAAALRALPAQAPPSRMVVPGLLDGLDAIRARVFPQAPADASARDAPRLLGACS
ncbi:glycosyltransferase family protein [Methylobacterium nigriterrae]|uniref:glycosyltransferase family protein n=1 Tax=Methylobacterium nigriterrae TaxID=3127512 RepID=UPI003013B034